MTQTQPKFYAKDGGRLYQTGPQAILAAELIAVHGLDESQISFDGDDPTPIFDYTAIAHLSLRLTDIKDMDCWIASRDPRDQRATAKCRVILPDGRTRSVEASAVVGELMHDGKPIETWQLAESMAQSRASRIGIRSVGINLMKAHKEFVKTGAPANGHTDHDPRKPYYDEIHMLAENLDLIKGGDKSEYRLFLAGMFLGRESAVDLDNNELNFLVTTLRAMDRVRRQRASAAVV